MLSSLLHAIPYVENDADRDARFAPTKDLRVQYPDGTIKRYNGAAWITLMGSSQTLSWISSEFGTIGNTIADDRNALDTLVNVTMQPNGGDLDIVGVPRIGSALVIPANVRLRFVKGAYLAPDLGVTVTHNGTLAPTLKKIFGGGGVVALAGGTVSTFFFEWWGVKGDGTDETIGMLAALTALQLVGGRIQGLSKTYRADGQLLLPNDGGATPRQRSMRISGSATSSHAGQTGAILGGTIFDLRWVGATGKIDSRGLGTLEIDRIHFKDDTNNVTPFVYFTNTTVFIHHNRFDGDPATAGITCARDAIIGGGTRPTGFGMGGDADSAFQGYGSDVHHNVFSKIRRGFFGRTACNDMTVRINWFLHDCGSNLAGGSAIEFLGTAADGASSPKVFGNTIEVGFYPYGVKAQYSVLGNYGPNGFFDPTVVHLAAYRFEANSTYNTVIDGFRVDTYALVSDVSKTSTQITSHQSQKSILTQPWQFQNNVIIRQPASNGLGVQIIADASGDSWDELVQGVGGVLYSRRYTPNGGATEGVVDYQRASATDKRIILKGSTNNQIQADAQLRVTSFTGTALFLGDIVDQSVFILNGQLRSTKAVGTAPFVITSTTAVPNLTVKKLGEAGGTVGLYGVAEVARAAAIAAPTAPSAAYVQAEAASAKTAIDAIRVALTNIGLTL